MTAEKSVSVPKDKQTAAEYEENPIGNINALTEQVKQKRYRAKLVHRRYWKPFMSRISSRVVMVTGPEKAPMMRFWNAARYCLSALLTIIVGVIITVWSCNSGTVEKTAFVTRYYGSE